MLRGLNPTKYSSEDNTLIYVAIARHIAGRRGKQNEDGDIFSAHPISFFEEKHKLIVSQAHIREAKQMEGSQHDRPVRDSTLGLVNFGMQDLCLASADTCVRLFTQIPSVTY